MKLKTIYLVIMLIIFSFGLKANAPNEKNLPLDFSKEFESLPKKNIKIPKEKTSSTSFNYLRFGSHTLVAPTIGIGRRMHFHKFALDISINDAFVPYAQMPKEYFNFSSIKVGFLGYRNEQTPSWYKGIALESGVLVYNFYMGGFFGTAKGYVIWPNIEVFFGKEYFSKNQRGIGSKRFFQIGVNLLPLVADYNMILDKDFILPFFTLALVSINYGIAF